MNTTELALRGDHIALDALLKATGLASSGGAARVLITDGLVRVDGQVELRKTCKLRAGQVVTFGDATVQVVGASAAPDGAPT
ncbi:MAG: RNA-binding S4 domain-containing protein [Leptothrix sp. (in: b-proteobacteria)]